ncbi:ninein homolog isoform X2 [Chironomus tepperi]|uniref:ninein homolog isoform X2 n=1 Tax=Chironomus tepperi TaxID=113505 RepID=UPI00391F205E
METSASTTTQVSPTKPSSDNESDREISPKYIVGTKKYGRRSRPTQNSDDLINDTSDSDNETTTTIVVASPEKKQSKVQRSVSQSDVHGAKRRRPLYSTKLKRCASLPSQKASKLEIRLRQLRQEREINEDSMDESDNLIKMSLLSQNLRVVWNSFEAGDVLNFQQLEIVCERVGLHKIAAKLAAEEVFEKLSIKRDGGIKFDDFLNLLQSDSDMFSSVENIGQKNVNFNNLEKKEDTQVYQDIVPIFSTESGCISNEDIVSMWTSANVPEPERLLHNLGFLSKTIKLSELCNVLEEEIQRQNTPDVLSTLLKASVALHKSEISSLRQSFRQLADENKKLFTDNKEINRRASILAQEIDERHTNLEDSTRSEIKSLEQRHNEAIRELTIQLTAEREQLGNLNSRLELKIKTMEAEELKLRQELLSLKDDNCALENEQAELHKQITELLEQNIKLNQDISEMEVGGGADERTDSHNEEMLDLIEKIETLQMENSNLRDKNDELQSDVESLNVEVMRWKNKSKVTRETLSIDEQEAITSAAIKRRGDSPSKSRNVEESPRMGKVRKFSNDIEETENSGEWMALNSELASSTPIPKVLPTYQKKDEEAIEQMKRKILELEEKVSEYKSKIEESKNVDTTSNNISNNHDISVDDLTKFKNENERLQNRVKELEDNLELMSKEYENCEDYWQAKLNEERLLFDDDQRQSDEKFAELLQKMSELEDQFAAQVEKNNGRLSPIDEKCQLESQYLELENEMEELKVHAQSLLDEKDKEIESMKLELTQLQNQSIASLKTPPRAASPDNVSIASSPISYLLNQNTITGPIRDYQNPNYVSKKNSDVVIEEPIVEEPVRIISPIQKPPSSNHSQHSQQPEISETSKELLEVNEALSLISNKSVVSNSIQSLNEINDGAASPTSVNEGHERLRKMKIIMDQMKEEIQELATQRESLIMELQQLQEARPILANAYKSTHPNLSQKLERLQIKNKHLQNVLRQQQHYTETIMYQTWHQQRQELNELRNRLEAQSIVISEQATRLASADLLVKDLYVENSHLTATIQRMEQQIARHNLLQQFAQSKSQMGSMSSIMP